MKLRNTTTKASKESSEASVDDRTSGEKQEQANWYDILPFFSYLPYFIFFLLFLVR